MLLYLPLNFPILPYFQLFSLSPPPPLSLLSVDLCYSPLFSIIIRYSLSFSAILCPSPLFFVTLPYSLSFSAILFHSRQFSVNLRYSSSLSAICRHSLQFSVNIPDYPSFPLFSVMLRYSPLFSVILRYSPPFSNILRYSPLSSAGPVLLRPAMQQSSDLLC